MESLPIYKTAIVPASTPALVGAAGQHRLMAYKLFGGSADSQVEFKDAATDTGTALLSDNCLAKTSTPLECLDDVGGLMFNNGLYVKPAGTGAICYVWYD